LPIIYSHLFFSHYLCRAKLDVCLFPANIIPLGYNGQAILTIHDLAVYKFPELFPEKLIDFDRRILVPRSLKKAAKIIAVSQSTKKDIIELFKIQPDKIEVIYEGVNSDVETRFDSNILNKYALGNGKYFLFIGTIEPRKNLIRLVEAYKKFVQSCSEDYGLVLAGKSGWKNAEIFRTLEAANRQLGGEKIKYLGYITDEEKSQLLRKASLFLFPSLYEGFGLPVIEAMAAGVPVIASNRSSLPEIIEGAGVLIDPESIDQLCEAMKKIISDVFFRQSLIALGQKKSQAFTWDRSAKQTLAIIETLSVIAPLRNGEELN
jgi:glycosyltransferase involved in cell wall biosynthesis